MDALEASLRRSQESRIALRWLVRLRWLAVAGQVAATAFAAIVLQTDPPLRSIGTVVAMTLLSNLALAAYARRDGIRPVVVPLVLLLDVLLLTALLYLTGGGGNPFSTLYIVHVALAVTVAGHTWAWTVAGVSVIAYAALSLWHLPLTRGQVLPAWALHGGMWTALALVAALIAYFIGRITTELRQRQAEIASLREQSARNERVAALTTLAAGAAHELGSPLGTIAVAAAELERAASTDSAIAGDARLIRAEVGRCRAILGRMRVDIADEAAVEAAAPLADLVERVKQLLPADQRKRLLVDLGDNPTIRGQLTAIEQALSAVVHNAFDASRATQPVLLSAGHEEAGIVLRIEDQGHGMAPEVVQRAGQPFFTTKPPGSGLGMGLFLARTIVERAGGSLTLESDVGQGTRVTVTLPA